MTTIDVDKDWRLLINGEWVEPEAGTYAIVDPATTEVVGHAPEATVRQAEDTAAAAREAFAGWKRLSREARCEYIGRLADEIARRSPDWVDTVQAETGATIGTTENLQVGGPAVDRFRYYATPIDLDENLDPVPTAKGPLGPAGLMSAHVKRQPVGVVACITPYNFPITNVAGKIAPALAAGCTTIVKPAPQDPLGILLLGEAVEAAGFPPGVVNILNGSGPEVPAALVDSRNVDMVSFTGSSPVGAKIMENGGKTMKRLLMELGGKGAAIVTDDADVGVAAQAIATVWGFHSGQICTAPTRVICHRSLYDQMVETLKTFSGFMKVGDPTERDTIIGPVITEVHRDRVEAFVRSGTDAGATMVCGGERPDLPGYYVAPTLLADCTPDMHVVREEAFGPVIVIMPFDDDDEAVALANDSDYGLYSYVFSGDSMRAFGIGQQLESGNVGLNVIQPHMEAPFGGFKMSGVGRDRGKWGIEAYSELQSINWIG
ncbi:MAG: aldehyde dehydrogenase family protein [Actinobacteria bacterium]|nr:aldehyde dehydrogenase family protein [Actinomycetota bacterium]NIS32139.1 aldehyde dehydrogenase family protein [Actinomycetota bacterium]NIT96072.1 aldehyde dehydrogenase family protein [Actinomycetota bacterium]NIU19764.1 aldehyde dehydrogenase family protein [Actinomycetota bacterium]NIU67206.1 aldehyde dehydrogenase family protein [Actinomycetota bacterium]